MKKLTKILALTFALILCFASCDSDDKQTTDATAAPNSTSAVSSDTAKATDDATTAPVETMPPHTHAFGDWAVTKNATCTEEGEKTRTCECGESEIEKLPVAHTVEVIQGKPATCTETGLSNGKKCSVCGEILAEQTKLPIKKQHNYVDRKCTDCGKIELIESKGLEMILNSDGQSYAVTYIGSCTDKIIVIPKTHNGKPVTRIDDWGLCDPKGGSEQYQFTDVIIPNGVTSIGQCAFGGSMLLANVTIPSSVTSIGIAAFDYCTELKNITFEGTKAQWNAIEKGEDWDADTGNYTVHCTDGDIAK